MNAHALLTAQGWRGTGNSLHPTSNSIGLTKPLLVGHKNDKHGLGQRKHHTSDMWWMKAFDQSLQALETSPKGTVVKSTTSGVLDTVQRGSSKWIIANGGLYGNFIKGDGLAGSIESSDSKTLQLANNDGIIFADKTVATATKGKERKPNKHKLKAKEKIKDYKNPEISQLKSAGGNKDQRKARKAAKRLLRQNSQVAKTSSLTEEKCKIDDISKKYKSLRKKSDESQIEKGTYEQIVKSKDKKRKKKNS